MGEGDASRLLSGGGVYCFDWVEGKAFVRGNELRHFSRRGCRIGRSMTEVGSRTRLIS